VGCAHVRINAEDQLPPNSRIVEISINSKFKLRALYLFENPVIDEAIKNTGWVTYPYHQATMVGQIN